MIRAVLLAIGKEFRLLRRDPVGLFMLILAPIAVIAAAGFSLSNVYGGGSSSFPVAVVDEDGGRIARAIVDALRNSHSLVVLEAGSPSAARAMVRESKRAVVAVVIPAGTTAAFERGSSPRMIVYSDPVRYLETVKIELALAELSRRINSAANNRARQQLASAGDRIRRELEQASKQAEQARASVEQFERNARRTQAEAQARIRSRIDAAIASARAQTEQSLDQAVAQVSAQAQSQIASERALLNQARDYLQRLKQTQAAFEKWFADLKTLAGSRASNIPAPPSFPSPPPALLALNETQPAPPDFASLRAKLKQSIAVPQIDISLPHVALPPLPEVPNAAVPPASQSATVPGTIGFVEEGLSGGQNGPLPGFNAFDLQVPGFAVTFLLIGMLMGVSLALIDERDWGTLDRLRAAAAPLGATFAGKLLARFAVGFVQMAVLFVAGWVFFGISLGQSPWALIVPSASIAFAGAAFGLVVAGVGRTRDAVLPVGATVIMTMAAIGGCWWPIDFEPQWMQTAALAMPTTWAMRAYNDLMIRGLAASSALIPSAVNLGYGVVYMVVGIAITRRRFAP
jgi:ABC-type Na+ efflux pump permease subunit